MTEAAGYLRSHLGARRPRIAILLGSSLAAIAEAPADPVVIAYREIPGFPSPGVSGHSGRLVAGVLGGRDVLILAGRVHPYETGDAAAMRPVIETLAALGVETLVDERDRQHYRTLGGLAMLALGRVPRTGDVFARGEHRFEVVDMDGRRVDKVLVSRVGDGDRSPPAE